LDSCHFDRPYGLVDQVAGVAVRPLGPEL